jgi:hypothetical protein
MKFIGKLATNGDFSIILISCEMPELKGHLKSELSIASGPKNSVAVIGSKHCTSLHITNSATPIQNTNNHNSLR